MKISDNVVDLSGKLKGSISLPASTKGATTISAEAPASSYLDNLPEGITPEIVKSVHDYNVNYIAAAARATCAIGLDALKANKDLANLQVTWPLAGKDSWTGLYDRTRVFPKPGGGDPITAYGVLNGKLKISMDDAGVGLLKLVKTEARAEALKILGGG